VLNIGGAEQPFPMYGSSPNPMKVAKALAEAAGHTLTLTPLTEFTGWRETDPNDMYEDAGHVGGDVQVGPAYSRRFTFGPVDGSYAAVTAYLYVEAGNDNRFSATTQTEFVLCTDLEDVGGSEIARDYTYEVGHLTYDTAAEADVDARAAMLRQGLWTVSDWDPTDNLRSGLLPSL
jgi:hypothetical protein